VKIHCFWLITSKLTLPTSAYFWYGGSHFTFCCDQCILYSERYHNGLHN